VSISVQNLVEISQCFFAEIAIKQILKGGWQIILNLV